MKQTDFPNAIYEPTFRAKCTTPGCGWTWTTLNPDLLIAAWERHRESAHNDGSQEGS
jgi:hypothetical protein